MSWRYPSLGLSFKLSTLWPDALFIRSFYLFLNVAWCTYAPIGSILNKNSCAGCPFSGWLKVVFSQVVWQLSPGKGEEGRSSRRRGKLTKATGELSEEKVARKIESLIQTEGEHREWAEVPYHLTMIEGDIERKKFLFQPGEGRTFDKMMREPGVNPLDPHPR